MSDFSDFNDFDLDLPEAFNQPPKVDGTWQRISIEPNQITGERYNLGVLFTSQGRRYAKLIQDHHRLKCLFDSQSVNNILFSIKHITELVNHQTIAPDGFILSEAMPASGDSVDEIVQRLYDQVVTLGRPVKEAEEKEDIEMVGRESLIKDVYQNLRTIGFDAERIIPQNRNLIVDESRHTIDAPLYAGRQIADIVSATNKAPHAINNKLNNSLVNLAAAINYRQDISHPGLFILRPNTDLGFTQQQIEAADNVIDQALWKAQKTTYIEPADSSRALAEEIANWFEVKQA